MKKRESRIAKQNKKGASKIGNIAWKNSKYSTPHSRLTLCVLYCVMIHIHYKDAEHEAAEFRPHGRTDWEHIRWAVLQILPQLEKVPLFTQQGEPILFTSLTPKQQRSRLAGRWANFFHVYDNQRGVKMWSVKDTEHPNNNPELTSMMPKARTMVDRFFGV